VEQAIAVAGALKVRDAVPHLLQMLARKPISGADLLERIPVVRALGEIADERALPALRELVHARSLFFRGALERLRDEGFLSLRRFPVATVRDLLEEGTHAGTERVRAECRRLLEAGRG
jgi:HEAT repeat protein